MLLKSIIGSFDITVKCEFLNSILLWKSDVISYIQINRTKKLQSTGALNIQEMKRDLKNEIWMYSFKKDIRIQKKVKEINI